jgi:restriction system protein
MSRRYRKSRREPGLIEIAATSNWKVSAAMSAVCVVAAAIVIPAMFGGSRVLEPLAQIFGALAWSMAAVFGGISLMRFLKQCVSPSPLAVPQPIVHRREPAAVVTNPPPPDREHPLPANAFQRQPDAPSAGRPAVWSRAVIDRIEWKRFEDLCCEFYRAKGIRAETTRLGADGGVDIRLFQDDANPQHCTAIVQCKAWSQAVGVKPVRELRGVMAHEKVDKAFFMAPNGFTEEARAFATENRITLLDSKLFLAMLERLPEAERQGLLAYATEGDWTTPTCPSCGVKMTARDSRRGRFWGCVQYPRCRAMLSMRLSAT